MRPAGLVFFALAIVASPVIATSSGILDGAHGELIAFSVSAGQVTLTLDPGRELSTAVFAIFGLDWDFYYAVSGTAEDGDLEVITAAARHTVVNNSGGPGSVHLDIGELCAAGCHALVYGAGTVDRITYEIEGVDASHQISLSNLRTFATDGYQPPEGISAAARWNSNYASVQYGARETISIDGSPFMLGGFWTSASASSATVGALHITSPDGSKTPCPCAIANLAEPAPGSYDLHWDRAEVGALADFLLTGVDVERTGR